MNLIGPQPVPKLADQACHQGWPFAYYKFPDATLENEYFNPAIVRWQQQNWLFVRRRRGPVGHHGTNTIECWSLTDNQPKRRHHIPLTGGDPAASFEDPRALVRGENVILSYCAFVHGKPGFAHQAMTGVRPGFLVEPSIALEIGGNKSTQQLNTSHEKNWCPFLREGVLHISYSLDSGRHTVLETRGGKVTRIWYGNAPTWAWGVLRGGTCAAFHDGLYWTFFHSSERWYCGRRRYHMGVLAFEPCPPFNVVRMARFPLLSASELDFRNQHAPPCVWPGGAVVNDSGWRVALGVNDTCCASVDIPHEAVEKLCYVTG